MWIGIAQLAVAGVGAGLIYGQILQVQKTLKAQTLSELYDQYFEICRLFLAKPSLRPYFYDKYRLKEGDDHGLRSEVATVCELIMGLLEHAVVQRANIPKHAWEHCWLPYLKDVYDNSAELELFYRSHRHFYSKDFCERVDVHLGSSEQKGVSSS